MDTVCVTGGIGSGKSVVCRICALRGVPVYDCDVRAKALMNCDDSLKASLAALAGEDIYTSEGVLDRQLLSERIFSSATLLKAVEAKVHEAVRRELAEWLEAASGRSAVAVVETAIPRKSAIDRMADSIWLVEAPVETRIARVQARSALTRKQILDRMEAQQHEFDALPAGKTCRIDNGGTPLLPQVDALLSLYNI